MFAHSAEGVTAAVGAAVDGLGGRLPLWVKMSPNVTDLPALVGRRGGCRRRGRDPHQHRDGPGPRPGHRSGPVLGAGGGGLSGPAIHPIAVRAVYETRAAWPDVPIVGVGGVATGEDAAELLAAGANAVQVGTATFADPRAPARVLSEFGAWCATRRSSTSPI